MAMMSQVGMMSFRSGSVDICHEGGVFFFLHDQLACFKGYDLEAVCAYFVRCFSMT